jgi:hypothetical protein
MKHLSLLRLPGLAAARIPGRLSGRLCGCETGGKKHTRVCGPGTRAGHQASVSRP